METARLMTYNVRHCRGLDDEVDLERTAEVIRVARPDILALQELDVGLGRSGRIDQPGALGEATGLHVYFEHTLEFDGGRYGIALASREPVSVSAIDLPRLGAEEPRRLLVAGWRGVTVLATHLSRNERARRAQLEHIGLLTADVEGPVVLLGDLNESPRGLGALRRAGLEGPQLATHPARRPRDQKDYVLATPHVSFVTARVIASRASDHLPLVAEVRRGSP